MIQVILTYIVNVIIVFVFFPILESAVQLVYPFSWDWFIKPLHLADKLDVYIVLSIALPIIVAIGLFLPPFSWLAHWLQGERKPNVGEAEYIEPLLEELCTRSGVSRNTLTLRMRTDEDINAFASGINHITIYTGALSGLDERHLLGVLAHELGHLRNRDTIYLTITYAMDRLGQLILNLVILLNGALNILALIPIVNIVIRIIQIVLLVMIAVVEYVLRLPKWITYYFDSRRREYAADAYAVSIGLGRELREGLVALGLATEQIGMLETGELYDRESTGFFSRLFITHPKMIKRIQRIDEGIEVYELKQSLLWDRMIRKAKCIQ
ncbi:MAG: M48 family metalloprotease [Veillonella sp. oral taxon 158]|jgi:peptidase, M48 family|uniref:M48 family metalloprotease n=1 Tax=Veillonella sp. oral taxon 158 TaxID=671228 RepID=UPI002356084C|nr:M48 family metalloprotease [Veillonella sp. oral taxon 158]MBS6449501.1 M48 family metalloprotease [Veillonella sp. oral taxon 158]